MRMSLFDKACHGTFYNFVRDDLPNVIKSSKIRRAFERFGQTDRATLKRALAWGTNPTLDITAVSGGDHGEFDMGIGSQVIRIDRGLVREFEAGRDWVTTRSGAKVHLAAVTVLHELMHWADDQDGFDNPAAREDEGELFEIFVYGKILG